MEFCGTNVYIRLVWILSAECAEFLTCVKVDARY